MSTYEKRYSEKFPLENRIEAEIGHGKNLSQTDDMDYEINNTANNFKNNNSNSDDDDSNILDSSSKGDGAIATTLLQSQ